MNGKPIEMPKREKPEAPVAVFDAVYHIHDLVTGLDNIISAGASCDSGFTAEGAIGLGVITQKLRDEVGIVHEFFYPEKAN